MSIPFWYNNLSILLSKEYIFELWPRANMQYSQKLNAITRLVLLLSSLGFFFTKSYGIIISCIITLIVIVYFYKTNNTKEDVLFDDKNTTKVSKEGFASPETYQTFKKSFTEPTSDNPLQNINMLDVNVNPQRNPAPPSFNKVVESDINKKVKEQINKIHGSDIDKKLFKNLGEDLNFENSMRQFYTMPNTRTPNDQKAFLDYCYGDLPSKKDK